MTFASSLPRWAVAVFFRIQSLNEGDPTFRKRSAHDARERLSERPTDMLND
jgi:hypothetical protein